MPRKRNTKNNVLTTVIVPRAKQIRRQNPNMAWNKAIKQASAEYRQKKNGGNILQDVGKVVGSFL